ncbi:hypothetical protein PMAYCL1PPCAC_05338, partial [Pristionchus mayeri]
MYYLPSLQDVSNLLVALNRFLALVFPFLFQKLFTRRFTLVALLFAIFFAFTPCFVTFAAPGFFIDMKFRALSFQIYLLHADSKVHFPEINRSMVIGIFEFGCNGISFVIYCIIATKIILNKGSNANDVRLFILGFLILLTNTPSITYQIYWAIYESDGSSYVFLTLPWVIMIKTLSPPLLMLLTNTGMRREV